MFVFLFIYLFILSIMYSGLLLKSARRKIEKMLVLNTRQIHQENRNASLIGNVKQVKIEDHPLFDFQRISTATNNFESANKIGQGGFGSVYKVN